MTPYDLIRKSAGIIPVKRGLIRISDVDRTKWLQGMCTQEITTIHSGGGAMTAFCNRQGKMIGIGIVRVLDDHILLETEPPLVPVILEQLGKLIIMDRVKLDDVSPQWQVAEIHGPGSWEALPIAPPPWFHHIPWQNGLASSNRTLGESGMTVILPHDAKFPELPIIDEDAYETARIETGFPKWGRDAGPHEIPSEAGLDPIAVSFNKGCYVGQEVLLRVNNFSEPPKRLVWLSIDSDQVPPPGTPVRAPVEDIGQVTSSSLSPRSRHAVAMAYVRKEYKASGTQLHVSGHEAVVNELPWHQFSESPPVQQNRDNESTFIK